MALELARARGKAQSRTVSTGALSARGQTPQILDLTPRAEAPPRQSKTKSKVAWTPSWKKRGDRAMESHFPRSEKLRLNAQQIGQLRRISALQIWEQSMML